MAEINGSGVWQRGYVYIGSQLLAVQQQNAVHWVHQDPIVKSKRITNGSGNVVSTIELDPWGGNTNRQSNPDFQPMKFGNYIRDNNASDEAMFRRYNRWWSRFDQPDPYDGSYDLNNPQSFNRYAYANNDPVNFVDPSGLMPQTCSAEFSFADCGGGGGSSGFWGGSRGFGGHIGAYNREYGGLSPRVAEGMADHNQRLQNTLDALAATRALQLALETDDPADWQKLLELLETNDTLVITQSQPGPLASILFGMQGGEPRPAPAVGGLILRIVAGILARRAVVGAAAIVFGHGARHLAGTGLSQRVVEMAIRNQLHRALANASASGSFWGRVVVNGTTIEYRAYTLANGTINVGTYYPIP